MEIEDLILDLTNAVMPEKPPDWIKDLQDLKVRNRIEAEHLEAAVQKSWDTLAPVSWRLGQLRKKLGRYVKSLLSRALIWLSGLEIPIEVSPELQMDLEQGITGRLRMKRRKDDSDSKDGET